MGGKKKRRGEAGEATKYITRNRAIKKLQLSLRDFRRLCILKGIYPREPVHRRKAQGGATEIKTLYYVKDIMFLAHEPIIWKFRELRAHMKKVKKAKERKEKQKASILYSQRPQYRLDHIVRERYPTLVDALQDLDDPLTLCSLFSKMAAAFRLHGDLLWMSHRLTIEFMHYVIEAQGLRKVFISIKGYYYQAEVMGQLVTWVTPHPFTPMNETLVDYRLMKVFAEFYIAILGFVNFRLYQSLNMYYPPRLIGEVPAVGKKDVTDEKCVSDRIASLNVRLKRNRVEEEDDDIDMHLLINEGAELEAAREEEKLKKQQQNLFKGLKFFLGRETNMESLTFVIRACKGEVSWDPSTYEGGQYPETDTSISHQIVDRPMAKSDYRYMSRYYIQPQWVYDCINARMLLPVQDYFPGATLPAHLSPFTDKELYIPKEKKELVARQKGEIVDNPVLRMDEDSSSEEEETENKEARTKKKQNNGKRKKGEGKGKKQERKKQKQHTATEEAVKETSKTSMENITEVTKEVENEVKDIAQEGESETIPVRREKEMKVRRGIPKTENQIIQWNIEKQEREDQKMAEMMIPRKKKRLYIKVKRKEARAQARVDRLTKKRDLIESMDKKRKKTKPKEV